MNNIDFNFYMIKVCVLLKKFTELVLGSQCEYEILRMAREPMKRINHFISIGIIFLGAKFFFDPTNRTVAQKNIAACCQGKIARILANLDDRIRTSNVKGFAELAHKWFLSQQLEIFNFSDYTDEIKTIRRIRFELFEYEFETRLALGMNMGSASARLSAMNRLIENILPKIARLSKLALHMVHYEITHNLAHGANGTLISEIVPRFLVYQYAWLSIHLIKEVLPLILLSTKQVKDYAVHLISTQGNAPVEKVRRYNQEVLNILAGIGVHVFTISDEVNNMKFSTAEVRQYAMIQSDLMQLFNAFQVAENSNGGIQYISIKLATHNLQLTGNVIGHYIDI